MDQFNMFSMFMPPTSGNDFMQQWMAMMGGGVPALQQGSNNNGMGMLPMMPMNMGGHPMAMGFTQPEAQPHKVLQAQMAPMQQTTQVAATPIPRPPPSAAAGSAAQLLEPPKPLQAQMAPMQQTTQAAATPIPRPPPSAAAGSAAQLLEPPKPLQERRKEKKASSNSESDTESSESDDDFMKKSSGKKVAVKVLKVTEIKTLRKLKVKKLVKAQGKELKNLESRIAKLKEDIRELKKLIKKQDNKQEDIVNNEQYDMKIKELEKITSEMTADNDLLDIMREEAEKTLQLTETEECLQYLRGIPEDPEAGFWNSSLGSFTLHEGLQSQLMTFLDDFREREGCSYQHSYGVLLPKVAIYGLKSIYCITDKEAEELFQERSNKVAEVNHSAAS